MNLDEVFGADGALAERLPGFTYRAAQQQMAELVVAALESGRHAVIEAGTGIGKTFAYLLPVLLLERRAIISTGTHTLQDQLFARDLPLLGAVVGRPMEVGAAQGPQQLSCAGIGSTRRCARARRDATTVAALQALDAWGQASASGDLTELEDLADDHALRAQVTSTVDNCLGRECALRRSLLRRRSAPPCAGGRCRHRQPSPAARRSLAEGQRVRRAVAGHRRRDRR